MRITFCSVIRRVCGKILDYVLYKLTLIRLVLEKILNVVYVVKHRGVILAEAPKVVVRAQAESTGLEELILNVKEENEI